MATANNLIKAGVLLLMLVTAYYIFIEMGWGLLISVIARTQGQAFLGAFVVAMLEIILSGEILPVEFMPDAAQGLSFFMPNRHYKVIVCGIMLKGYALADIWPQLLILTLMGLALYLLAIRYLRRGFE